MKKSIILLLALIPLQIFAQKSVLQSGPMVGYAEMHEVMLWVQTNESAKVKIAYYTEANPKEVSWTNEIETVKKNGYTAKLLADNVKHSQTYKYDLYINNKKIAFDYKTEFQTIPMLQFKADPANFSFASGSGTYLNEEEFDRPGKGYGGDYQIFNSILEKDPDFMIWLGDNVYLRQNEWDTRTGITHRYTRDRSLTEMQALLASVSHYAIIDDHDFGPNDSDGSFWNKDMTEEIFADFWANPSHGVSGVEGGAITFFNWQDVDFFMLDNRYFRDPNYLIADDKTMLGEEQLDWLKKALVSSNASFKFVVMGGQFLTEDKNYETYSNYGFEKERLELINFIYTQGIKNVVFLDGDRHHTELSILEGKHHAPTIYDLTVSPLTSHGSDGGIGKNQELRVEGTLVTDRNFSIIEFSGKYRNRKMKMIIYDSNGKEIWTKEIEQQ